MAASDQKSFVDLEEYPGEKLDVGELSVLDWLTQSWGKLLSLQARESRSIDYKYKKPTKYASILFGLALLIYLITRLIGLSDYPIYFFTDEALHAILADSLVENGFRYQGQLLPTYLPFGSSFGLNSVSVYLQVIPYLLFGKSVFNPKSC